VGVVDGKRKQLRKRYATEKEARAALDAGRGDVAKGTYVHPSKVTLAEACEDWLAAKHGLKPSTLQGHRLTWRRRWLNSATSRDPPGRVGCPKTQSNPTRFLRNPERGLFDVS
jgi:hypothetical protein